MSVKKLSRDLLMLIVGLIFLVPFWMVLINSLKTTKEANLFGMNLPSLSTLRLENYVQVFTEGQVLRGLLNGLLEASASVLILIVVSSIGAFVISRNRSRMSNGLYYLFLLGLIIPPAFIPTYLVLKGTGLLDTYAGIILIFTAYGLPFNIFLYSGFIKGIPREIDESAVMEGAGTIRMFYSVVFPLLMPITVTCFIFNFVGAWNDVMIPLFFVSSDKWALPLSVYKFYSTYSKEWNLVFAHIVYTVTPLVAVYIFCQKYMVAGMTAGAVKG
jgi:raffinose/stachyose/melibiose transport system permease protein